MKKIILLMITFLSIVGCTEQDSNLAKSNKLDIQKGETQKAISYTQYENLIKKQDIQIPG